MLHYNKFRFRIGLQPFSKKTRYKAGILYCIILYSFLEGWPVHLHFFWPAPPGVVSVALSDLCIEEVLAGVALDQVVQAPLDDAERIGKLSGRPVPRLELKHSPR